MQELAPKPVEKALEVVQYRALPPGANPLLTPYTPVSYHPFEHPYLLPPYRHPRKWSSSTPRVSKRNFQPLSPMIFETEVDGNKLTKYFQWLSKVYPAMKQQLEECLVTLNSEDIVFGTLLDVPIDLWKEWRVSNGLMIMIKGHTKKYEREDSKQRV